MISRYLLITGSPRSGTSTLQKILRDHPAFWSLPSESELIWHQFCHPELNNWDSEVFGPEDVTPEAVSTIHQQLEAHTAPAFMYRMIERFDFIWSYNRSKFWRPVLRNLYLTLFPKIRRLMFWKKELCFLDKTSSNCLRLGYFNEVFPEAKIIYLTRKGQSNVNSLINGWLNPDRFFTFDLPDKLNIPDYPYDRWCFLLPPNWRNYVSKTLAEVSAFQWLSCHEAMLREIDKPKYKGRILQVKLEDLSENPKQTLQKISDFIEVPWDDYFSNVSDNLPIVNSPDNNRDQDKWQEQNKERIESVMDLIEPMNRRLGY